MQTPTLIKPNSGTRNQKIGSCEPSKRSFFVKSKGDSVALPPTPRRPFGWLPQEEVLDTARDTAKILSAEINSGNDVLRQRSKDSANVMNVPALRELQSAMV